MKLVMTYDPASDRATWHRRKRGRRFWLMKVWVQYPGDHGETITDEATVRPRSKMLIGDVIPIGIDQLKELAGPVNEMADVGISIYAR